MDVNEGRQLSLNRLKCCIGLQIFLPSQNTYPIVPNSMLSDETYMLDLINKINQKRENDFPLTHNEEHCRFCVYRSLCDRGTQAGSFNSSEQLESEAGIEIPDINMAQIDEIEF